MAHKLMLLLISALVVASFIGLGADFRSYEAVRGFSVQVVADDQEFIDLKPVQPYAYLNPNDGKIYFDFSQLNPNYPGEGGIGVSPNTTYAFDKVFNVSNHIWSNDSEYYDGVCVQVQVSGNLAALIDLYSPQAVDGATSPATATDTVNIYLNGGEEAPVGMVIDTNGRSMGTYDGQISITAHAGVCTVVT
jgi:hypothetical protein